MNIDQWGFFEFPLYTLLKADFAIKIKGDGSDQNEAKNGALVAWFLFVFFLCDFCAYISICVYKCHILCFHLQYASKKSVRIYCYRTQ